MTKSKIITFNEMDESKTILLAQKISTVLSGGDSLLLSGEIGTGKTFFARSLIQEHISNCGGQIEDIPSPSFTIVQLYDHIAPPVWHVDLYRVDCSDELEELGLDEAYYSDIVVIEWPEKLGLYMPERFLSITFEHEETRHEFRKITVETSGPNWGCLFNTLRPSGAKKL